MRGVYRRWGYTVKEIPGKFGKDRAQAEDIAYARQAVNYESIQQFVLQVIREHERQDVSHNGTVGEPAGWMLQRKRREPEEYFYCLSFPLPRSSSVDI